MKYGIFSHYIYIFGIVLLLLAVGVHIIKKEYYENPSNNTNNSQKYTIKEISFAVNTLIDSLSTPYTLVKVHKVHKNGPYLSFECMLYNVKHPSIENFAAKVKIPLGSKKYTLVSASSTASNEVIENGTYSIKESQKYADLNN